mgnify:FL=1
MALTKIENDALSNTVTANVASLTIGANVSMNTSTVFVGNSTVNTVITSSSITVNGTISMASSFMRNRIINGGMIFSQAAAANTVTPATTSAILTNYPVDRWQVLVSAASKLTAAQSTTTATGFGFSTLITSSSAYTAASSDYFTLTQKIEGYNFADLVFGTASAKTITLSFWVRSSLTGTFGGSIQNSAQNRSYPFTYTINAANTFEKKTITIAGDTTGTWIGFTNGIGLWVNFSLGAGSTYSGTASAWAGADYRSATGATSVVGTNGATFYLTGVQVEEGSVATPFEARNIGLELNYCQRYFQKSYQLDEKPGGATTYPVYGPHLGTYNGAIPVFSSYDQTGTYGHRWDTTVPMKVRMRTNPTVLTYNPYTGSSGVIMQAGGGGNGGNISVSGASDSNQRIYVSSGLSSGYYPDQFLYHFTLNSEL